MNKSLSKKKNEFLEIETIDTGETYYLEEDVYVPEEMVRNKSLVRMDMNIVQFPIFSKNAKRKRNEITTYYFNQNRDTYITVTPSAGDLIPGEAEERIFIALMKLMKEKGMRQEFFVSAKEIKESAKINSNNYISDIKKALSRLSKSSFSFKNTLYSNELNQIFKEEIVTQILNFKSRTMLSTEEKYKIKREINDNRVKEVYLIKISDHFYKNIVKRGYLVYDSDILLGINSTIARTLYMLLEKIRFNKLYVKESIFALIKKIPLKYEKKSLPMTIKTLEKSLKELQEKDLITDYNFIKETTWENSELEVFFEEKHNHIKQDRFIQDNEEVKDIYNNLLISFTEKNVEEVCFNITDEMIETIYSKLPKKAKELKLMRKTIIDQLEKYSYIKVLASAIYLSNQSKLTSPRAYFLKILESDWTLDLEKELEKEEKLKEKRDRISQKSDVSHAKHENFDDVRKIEKEKISDYFSNLSEDEKKKLEEKTYKSYILECGGVEGKIQKLAFEAGKNSLIMKYIDKNNLYQDALNNSKQIEDIRNYDIRPNENYKGFNSNLGQRLKDMDKIKDTINQAISLADMINDYSETERINLLKNILKDVIKLITLDELTREKLREIIDRYIKI